MGRIDVLWIIKEKLDIFFVFKLVFIGQFQSSFGIDRNKNGGRTVLHLKENIPSKLLPDVNSYVWVEKLFNEINLH